MRLKPAHCVPSFCWPELPRSKEARAFTRGDRHIEEAISKEWPAMAQHRATLSTLRAARLIELLHDTLTLKPADDSQRIAQPEMMKALHTALDARRQRIVVSQSAVGTVKWAGILLQGLCTLIAIAMVHSDNRLSCGIAMTLFATGIALSLLLIAAYSRPFTGEISVRPDLLKQVITSEPHLREGQPLVLSVLGQALTFSSADRMSAKCHMQTSPPVQHG